MAVGLELWQEWNFAEDNGTDASCDLCAAQDNSRFEFQRDFCRSFKELEKVQVATRPRWLHDGEIRFKKSYFPDLAEYVTIVIQGSFEMFKFGAEVEIVDAEQIGPVADD